MVGALVGFLDGLLVVGVLVGLLVVGALVVGALVGEGAAVPPFVTLSFWPFVAASALRRPQR